MEDLQKNFQDQQKQRQAEMESYKNEIAVLHEKNVQYAINESTASLKVNLETLKKENVRLNQEVQSSKTDHTNIIIAFLVALVIGFILEKFI